MSSIDELTIALSIDQSAEFTELLKLLKTFKRDAEEAVRAGRDIGVDIGPMREFKESLDWIQTKMELILPANLERKVIPSAAGALARNIELAGFKETGKEFFKKISDVEVIREKLGMTGKTDEEVLDAMGGLVEEMVDHLKWVEKYQLTGPQAARFVNAVSQIYGAKETLRGRGIFTPIFDFMGEQHIELQRWAKNLPETAWAKEFQYKTLTPEEIKERELWTADTAKKLVERETPELKKLWEESFGAEGGELARLREYLGYELFWRLEKLGPITKEERQKIEYFMLKQLERQREESQEKQEYIPLFGDMYKMMGELLGLTQTQVFGTEGPARYDLIIEKTDAVMKELQRVGLTTDELERDFGKVVAIEQSIRKLSESAIRRFPETLEHVVTVSKMNLDLVTELRDASVDQRKFHQVNFNQLLSEIRKLKLIEPEKDVTLVRKAARLPEELFKDVKSIINTLVGTLTKEEKEKAAEYKQIITKLEELIKRKQPGFRQGQ